MDNNPGGTPAAGFVERLLTYNQVGKLLGISSRTVWTFVDRGDLPAVRFGNSVRIDPTDLRTFIERSKYGPIHSAAEEGDNR